MGEWAKRLSRMSAYINQPKIRTSDGIIPQTKMGRTDCPAWPPDSFAQWVMRKIRQCHPVSPKPITDQWTAGAGICGRYKIGLACLPVRFLVNLGQDRTNSVIWLLSYIFEPTLPNSKFFLFKIQI